MFKTFLPAIMRQDVRAALPLGCQIEGHVGNRARWIVPRRQYQIHVKWAQVEPIMGLRNWSAYDADFAALAGQRVTVGIKCAPEWARLWPGYIASPPLEYYYNELARFIMALLARYPIDAIELFNEPDCDREAAKWAEEYFGAWCINDGWYAGGLLYGQMTETVYYMLHEAYPGVRIIAGAMMMHEHSLEFLDGMIAGGLRCDAVSFHKYISLGGSFNAPFEVALSIYNRVQKSLILSETSVTADIDSPELQQAQANYLAYLRQNYLNSPIEVIQWYTLADNGWLSSDLIHGGQATPAYEVWRADR